MRVAVIGAGNVGGTIGEKWAAAGRHVAYGLRDPSRRPGALSFDQALDGAEVVLLAVPGVTVNLLLPGGATVTGMLPLDAVPEGQGFLEPAVMGSPIVWLASDEAAGVHDERIVAAEFERWLHDWHRRR